MSARKVKSTKPSSRQRKKQSLRYVSTPERIQQMHRLRHRFGYSSVRELIDRAVDVFSALSSHVADDGTIQILTPDQRVLICAVGHVSTYDHLPTGASSIATDSSANGEPGQSVLFSTSSSSPASTPQPTEESE